MSEAILDWHVDVCEGIADAACQTANHLDMRISRFLENDIAFYRVSGQRMTRGQAAQTVLRKYHKLYTDLHMLERRLEGLTLTLKN